MATKSFKETKKTLLNNTKETLLDNKRKKRYKGSIRGHKINKIEVGSNSLRAMQGIPLGGLVIGHSQSHIVQHT